MKIDKNKTLEQLHKAYMLAVPHHKKFSELGNIKLCDLNLEQIRSLITHNIGLTFIMPLAIEIINTDILAKTQEYKGDLLITVLKSEKHYWKTHKRNWLFVVNLFLKHEERVKSSDLPNWFMQKCYNAFRPFIGIN